MAEMDYSIWYGLHFGQWTGNMMDQVNAVYMLLAGILTGINHL